MTMADSPRNYGLGNSFEPISAPVARPITDPEVIAQIRADGGCPVCHCLDIMEIKVRVRAPLLRGGVGLCTYLGCPACQWASPAVTVADPPKVPLEV